MDTAQFYPVLGGGNLIVEHHGKIEEPYDNKYRWRNDLNNTFLFHSFNGKPP